MNKAVGLSLSPKHSGNGQAVTHSAAGLAAGSPLIHSQGTLPDCRASRQGRLQPKLPPAQSFTLEPPGGFPRSVILSGHWHCLLMCNYKTLYSVKCIRGGPGLL